MSFLIKFLIWKPISVKLKRVLWVFIALKYIDMNSISFLKIRILIMILSQQKKKNLIYDIGSIIIDLYNQVKTLISSKKKVQILIIGF